MVVQRILTLLEEQGGGGSYVSIRVLTYGTRTIITKDRDPCGRRTDEVLQLRARAGYLK